MAQSGLPGQTLTQVVYFSLDNSRTTIPTDYVLLGGVNSTSGIGVTKTTGDVTTGNNMEKIITGQSQDGSVNGFYREETAANQATLQDYIDGTFQSCGWLRFEEKRGAQTKTRNIPVVFTAMTTDATVGEVMTFELSYESDGAPQNTVA